MKTIQPEVDKDNCYEVVDGQNHYLVSYDYGCYFIKDDATRIRCRDDWKKYVRDNHLTTIIITPHWHSKILGTRIHALKKCLDDAVKSLNTDESFKQVVFVGKTDEGLYSGFVYSTFSPVGSPSYDLGTHKGKHYAMSVGVDPCNSFTIGWGKSIPLKVGNRIHEIESPISIRHISIMVTDIVKPQKLNGRKSS